MTTPSGADTARRAVGPRRRGRLPRRERTGSISPSGRRSRRRCAGGPPNGSRCPVTCRRATSPSCRGATTPTRCAPLSSGCWRRPAAPAVPTASSWARSSPSLSTGGCGGWPTSTTTGTASPTPPPATAGHPRCTTRSAATTDGMIGRRPAVGPGCRSRPLRSHMSADAAALRPSSPPARARPDGGRRGADRILLAGHAARATRRRSFAFLDELRDGGHWLMCTCRQAGEHRPMLFPVPPATAAPCSCAARSAWSTPRTACGIACPSTPRRVRPDRRRFNRCGHTKAARSCSATHGSPPHRTGRRRRGSRLNRRRPRRSPRCCSACCAAPASIVVHADEVRSRPGRRAGAANPKQHYHRLRALDHDPVGDALTSAICSAPGCRRCPGISTASTATPPLPDPMRPQGLFWGVVDDLDVDVAAPRSTSLRSAAAPAATSPASCPSPSACRAAAAPARSGCSPRSAFPATTRRRRSRSSTPTPTPPTAARCCCRSTPTPNGDRRAPARPARLLGPPPRTVGSGCASRWRRSISPTATSPPPRLPARAAGSPSGWPWRRWARPTTRLRRPQA